MCDFQLTASIVLYKPDEKVFDAINSFINVHSLNVFLYLIDNSPTDLFKEKSEKLFQNKNTKYIHTGSNLGYGAGHNIAIRETIDKARYHLVLNPDVSFGENVLKELYDYMESDKQAGQIIPKVLYPDGKTQYVCKLIPTPLNLFSRLLPGSLFKKYNENFELRFSGYNKIMNIPYLSGCFMFLRCSALKEVGLFDEQFFMYPEDIDLTRRMHKKYKTIFYPYVSIIHEHTKSSFKSARLFAVHMYNMIKYFNKWGWFFDSERSSTNKIVLKQLTQNPK